jgi:hypothetical protein
MEIKLNVDGAQVSNEVRELLDSLTLKQKQSMGLQLLKHSLQDMETRFSKRVGIKQAIKDLESEELELRWVEDDKKYGDGMVLQSRNPQKSGWYGEWRGADQSLQSKFDRLTKYYSEPATYFRETIFEEMLKVGRERVEEAVKASKKVEEAINTAVKEIEDHIPEMVQNAMRQFFVDVLSKAMRDTSLAFQESEHQRNLLGELKGRMDRNNIY